MNITSLSRLALLGAACIVAQSASADIMLNFAEKPSADSVVVSRVLISDLTAGPKTRNAPMVTDTISIQGLTATIPVTDEGDARYRIAMADAPAATRDYFIDFYTSPGDNIQVAVEAVDPMLYKVSGTPLMDGIAQINAALEPCEEQLMRIQNGQLPPTAFAEVAKTYDRILMDYIEANPTAPATVYAMISLDDEPFEKYYAQMNPALASTPLFPFLKADKERRDEQKILEAKKQALSTGTTPAPEFTLEDINGKQVSLADFRGKWVVLDFWGSWCIWCIKGFPELKKTYAQYDGKLEVIGIDCGDTKEAWKAAVAKYKLPWVNLYNPDKPGNLTQVYPVQGFPTKIIISPEGNIMNIFTGEVPEFYTRLAELIK